MAEDEMSIDERRKYLKKMWPRYAQAERKERNTLLTEMEAVTGMHRKSLTRLMKGSSRGALERKKSSTQRSVTYGKEVQSVVSVVSVVWESLDYICAERLQPQLLSTAHHLAHFGELDRVGVVLTPKLEEQLATVSRATVQRMTTKLRRLGRADAPLPRRGPERANRGPERANRGPERANRGGNSATRGVPMGRIPWQTQEAGHFEVDLVHHCGGSTQGEYAHTLQMVDALTGWSERVAVLHLAKKSYQQEEGKMRRKWDLAKTPYERLKQSGALSAEKQEELERLYAQTNPRELRREIYRRLSQLWKWQERRRELSEPEHEHAHAEQVA